MSQLKFKYFKRTEVKGWRENGKNTSNWNE